MSDPRSRPARLASELTGAHQGEAADMLVTKRVLMALERTDADSVATFELALNEMLRICPNVGIALPEEVPLVVDDEIRALAEGITGTTTTVSMASIAAAADYDATLVVGSTVRDVPGWITISSDGWIGRTGSWIDGAFALPGTKSASNPIGADVAASIGVGRVFRYLFGHDPGSAFELSAYKLGTGPLGRFTPGPVIPTRLPTLDALLVGCGSVMHGWANTVRRLPIAGRGRAVDPEAVGLENVGTYVCAFRVHVGLNKVEVLKAALEPRVLVTPDADFAELFGRRLEGELGLPPLVVAGLDETSPRHVVQRWWPTTLIDMGTHGFTTQVIVKSMTDDGMCLLDALPPNDGPTNLRGAAARTGLVRPLSATELLDAIDDHDVQAAPDPLREALRAAKAAGVRRCSWIRAADVHPGSDQPYSAAAPFVAALTGTLAAGRTVAFLMGGGSSRSVRMNSSFASERLVILGSRSSDDCECTARRLRAA